MIATDRIMITKQQLVDPRCVRNREQNGPALDSGAFLEKKGRMAAPVYASDRLFVLIAETYNFLETEAEELIAALDGSDAVAERILCERFTDGIANVRRRCMEISKMLGDGGVWQEQIVGLQERFERAREAKARSVAHRADNMPVLPEPEGHRT